jgi:hypothetical protein
MKTFQFNKKVDPGVLHKILASSGFIIIGITYDSGTNISNVMLDDTETKDPTSVVDAYVYTPYIPPNYPNLYSNAQTTVNSALTQYNNAVTNYQTALTAWNSASTTTTKFNAVEGQVVACASAISATKEAIAALVNVVKVLAQERSIEASES